jgi:hypothetical protein
MSTGLVGWWPLHRTAGPAVDLSGEANPATVNGPSRGVGGRGGLQAMSFNGSGDYLNVGDGGAGTVLDLGFPATYMAWVRDVEGADTASHSIFGKRDSVSNGTSFVMRFSEGTPNDAEAYINDGSGYDVLTYAFDWTPDVWYHVCFTVSESGDCTLYVDGQAFGTQSFGLTPASSSEPAGIGSYTGAAAEEEFPGTISDVRVYDRELSAQEVLAAYRQGGGDYVSPPGAADGGVVYWTLDEDPANTSTATDSFGSDDGTINGATQADPAIRGTGLSFDGTDDVVDPGDVAWSGNSLTISLFVRPDDDGNRDFVHGGFDGTTSEFRFGANGGGTGSGTTDVIWRAYDGSVQHGLSPSSVTLQTGEWYHLVAVYDESDTEYRLYVNGELQDSVVDSYGPGDADNAEPWGVGAQSGSGSYKNFLLGVLDDVRVYEAALTDAEIHDLYRYGTFGRDLRARTVQA